MYDERRYNSEMKTAKRLGMEEGMKLGKLETAKQLKSLGVDVNIIAQSTGIDIDQIKAL